MLKWVLSYARNIFFAQSLQCSVLYSTSFALSTPIIGQIITCQFSDLVAKNTTSSEDLKYILVFSHLINTLILNYLHCKFGAVVQVYAKSIKSAKVYDNC